MPSHNLCLEFQDFNAKNNYPIFVIDTQYFVESNLKIIISKLTLKVGMVLHLTLAV